jgi:hypothetical protein
MPDLSTGDFITMPLLSEVSTLCEGSPEGADQSVRIVISQLLLVAVLFSFCLTAAMWSRGIVFHLLPYAVLLLACWVGGVYDADAATSLQRTLIFLAVYVPMHLLVWWEVAASRKTKK